ncbi:MAG: LacI family transcriptional regulator [Clostridia bacterium]|nr:LacI family transcriptional regulator [Clostridia bacterium]
MNINEIAKKAGVSRSTVSRVLNDHPRVKASTRQDIRRVINDLNYYPNAAARSLASRRTDVIGVLVYNITQPFWTGVFSGIEQYVTQNTTYGIFLANCKTQVKLRFIREDHKQNLKNLIQRGVAGLIIALGNDLHQDDLEYLLASGIPFVIIQSNLHDERIVSVNVDNVAGAYQATRYLLKLGHRQIVHAAGPLEGSIARERLEGFTRAMRDADIPLTEDSVIRSGFLFNDGYWSMKRLLSGQAECTAVLFANDAAAFGGYHAANEAGISIPGKLSIVGFDHLTSEMDIAGLLPDLTTMGQPVSEIGSSAAELLVTRLSGGESVEPLTLPMTLYEGHTAKKIARGEQ